MRTIDHWIAGAVTAGPDTRRGQVWKASLFGDTHVHGTEGVAFYSRAKVVTSRWPGGDQQAAHMTFRELASGTNMSFPTAA